jgi:hypothetical protein
MEVRHRPVVSLSTDTEAQATNEVSETVGAPSTVAPAVKHENSGATRAASVVLDNISAEPYARNGQRFSAQFGPDVLSPA